MMICSVFNEQRSPVIGRRVSLKLTMDADRLNIASTEKAFHERERTTMRETVTYIADVKEAFLDEPAKFDEFLKLMKDVCDHKYEFFTFGLVLCSKFYNCESTQQPHTL